MDTNTGLRMKHRDRKAEFVSLLEEEESRIYRYIRTLVRTRTDADEAFQEAVLVAWRKFEEFETGTNFRAWICQIAYFAASNSRRAKRNSNVSMDDEFLRAIADERELADERLDERAWALETCLEKLRDRDRDLLRHRYEQSMTAKEIAMEVGRSAMAIQKAINRVHHSLMECVDQVLRKQLED